MKRERSPADKRIWTLSDFSKSSKKKKTLYVFAEGATLLFYAATGYKFRPREDNPYLAVRAEELEEFGLGGGDAEEPGKEAAPA